LVFDDPSTSQPNDFWLHPCDCLPQQWGTEWPADPIALENIPPTSNGSFIPEPFSIVSGLKRAGEWFLRPRQQLFIYFGTVSFVDLDPAMQASLRVLQGSC